MSRTLLASDELGAIAGDLGVVTEALMALQAREEGTVKPSSRAFVALQVTSARFRGHSSPILNLAPTSAAVLDLSATILSTLEIVLREAAQ